MDSAGQNARTGIDGKLHVVAFSCFDFLALLCTNFTSIPVNELTSLRMVHAAIVLPFPISTNSTPSFKYAWNVKLPGCFPSVLVQCAVSFCAQAAWVAANRIRTMKLLLSLRPKPNLAGKPFSHESRQQFATLAMNDLPGTARRIYQSVTEACLTQVSH